MGTTCRSRATLHLFKSIAAAGMLAAGPSHAQPRLDECLVSAARTYAVSPALLAAIRYTESKNRDSAIRVNSDGSIDRGAWQINSIHLSQLARWSIGPDDLHDPCRSAFVAAWHLRSKFNQYGTSWRGVGAYKSATRGINEAYANEIRATVLRFAALLPGDDQLLGLLNGPFTALPKPQVQEPVVDLTYQQE